MNYNRGGSMLSGVGAMSARPCVNLVPMKSQCLWMSMLHKYFVNRSAGLFSPVHLLEAQSASPLRVLYPQRVCMQMLHTTNATTLHNAQCRRGININIAFQLDPEIVAICLDSGPFS